MPKLVSSSALAAIGKLGRRVLEGAAAGLILAAPRARGAASSDTWKGDAPTNNWNSSENWGHGQVPTATASVGDVTSVNGSIHITLPATVIQEIDITASPAETFVIDPGAELEFAGDGLVESTEAPVTFDVGAGPSALVFDSGSAPSLDARIQNQRGGQQQGGDTFYESGATAGSSVINDNAGGETIFGATEVAADDSTAGSATITNSPSGGTYFEDDSTAGSATISDSSGGTTFFDDHSTAGAAHIHRG